MKVYISGKITGLLFQHARQIFEDAETHLLALGYEVVNPMKLPHDNKSSWARCMAIDIDALKDCDAIFMLNNWQDSTGANVERELANVWGLKTIPNEIGL